ncbi:MAG: RNA polymerase sigma factor [Nocardioidaceae bacterium]|nr:RNA polymerase sigma factor [Nocardioidaceae bacterium]
MGARDDGDLVAAMRAGDEDAFRQVYRAVQPGLLRYLSVLVGVHDAEDVAGETWAQAIRDLDLFLGSDDAFRGWLTTIGRNRALDLLRSKGRRPILDVPEEEIVGRADGRDTEADALALVGTAEALRLIATLPPDQAEAVLLRAVVGLNAKAAGQVLGKGAGAVRTAAYRGLRSLEKKLQPEV